MATATDLQADLEDFVRFLSRELERGKVAFSVEQSVEEFRLYQLERDRLREEIRPALERSRRGESLPMDIEAMKAEVTRRLAAKGIVDEPGKD